MSEPILKQASDALKPHEPRLLHNFARVFNRKRPPQSMRALAPLAMVLLLETFGLAFLLDRNTVRLALAACRGPGKGNEDDMLDDSDDMAAIRWAAHRQGSLDRAYRSLCREVYNSESTGYTYPEWIKKSNSVPNRITFERQWGERNPIDPTTAPKCFDPRAQLSVFDAISTERDGVLGVFVSDISLRSEAPPVVECMGQTLDLGACETLDMAAWRAVSKGWIAYLDHRGAVVGLRLIPRTDGIQTRLRAPLANIVAMYADDPRDKQIAELESERNEGAAAKSMVAILEAQIAEWRKETESATPIDAGELMRMHEKSLRQWQRVTGADKPEDVERAVAERRARINGAPIERMVSHEDGNTTVVIEDNSDIDASASKVEVNNVEAPGIWRMVWPDKDAAPLPLACANTIVAHRRGEFAELEFPTSPRIFDNVRAWLMFHQFGVCSPVPDATGYATCAIGANGEIPPSWGTMKEAKRNAYPGFVLFAPDGSARVVFRAKEATFGKVGKRKAKEAKS